MIISIADIYDALTSDRPYRSAFTQEKALFSLEQLVGVSFDEKIFKAFRTWLKNETGS
jgi:HD-GYP domain-containing protein (c-di-GMP phosphodiesterase class II)